MVTALVSVAFAKAPTVYVVELISLDLIVARTFILRALGDKQICARSMESGLNPMEAPLKQHQPGVWVLLLCAWVLALVSTLAVLFVGEVMGQLPCVLCWFQRAFMFPLVLVLGVACCLSDAGVWRYALPLAVMGWLIALYHNLLYFGLIPESIKPCGAGPSCSGADMTILSGVPLPLLSLGVFSLLIILLVLIRRRFTV